MHKIILHQNMAWKLSRSRCSLIASCQYRKILTKYIRRKFSYIQHEIFVILYIEMAYNCIILISKPNWIEGHWTSSYMCATGHFVRWPCKRCFHHGMGFRNSYRQDSNDFSKLYWYLLCLHSYVFPSQTELKVIGHHNTYVRPKFKVIGHFVWRWSRLSIYNCSSQFPDRLTTYCNRHYCQSYSNMQSYFFRWWTN
jgi:hypothetical protein